MDKLFQSFVLTAFLSFLAGCASAPLDYPKRESHAIADTSQTREAIRAKEWVGGKDNVNGFYPLTQGFDAFGTRLLLMDYAEASIDAQYFLMKPDDAGMVFAARLLEAADRGVRVRFLLDDIFTTVEDSGLATLDAHPNIEVRVFNPIARKGIYGLNYLGHFSLANRRMHNKAFVVDNQVAVVGGIAIALAAKNTLENFMGALNLFADRPVSVGDLCRYDEDSTPGWRPVGWVESIGLRSTKIRRFDRTLITIPNSEFAQRNIVNQSVCDRFLLTTTLGLRYETTDDQMRFLLAQLRELLQAHPKTIHTVQDPIRVRFVGFGDYSLNVAIRAYIATRHYNEFLAVQEDIKLRVMKIIKQAGTGFAFPSRTLYHTRDAGLEEERQQAAEQQVREWASAHQLPFPDFEEKYRKQIEDTLDYPPEGSPDADST